MLFVFPTAWDVRQLEACRTRWCDRFEVEFASPADIDCDWNLDVVAYMEGFVERYAGQIDGVTSSSDYPGAVVAAALAARLGLPGPRPQSVLLCSHKYYSRLRQRESLPEVTPAFALVDPEAAGEGPPAVGFPCFVKPVKGAFSVFASPIRDLDEMRRFFARPKVEEFRTQYLHIFNRLVDHFTSYEVDGRWFLAEQLLQGALVTVEGFCRGADVEILGVTDSERHPETGSFVRFVFPSRLEERVQARMRDGARRVIGALGLTDAFFNVEMMYDPVADRVWIIEVNPRNCGEFADLYEKVLGFNSYELLLELASGERPTAAGRRMAHGGPYPVAASYPLRVFEPVRVERAPDVADRRAAEALFPGTLVWNECGTGDDLVDFESLEDGQSYRYAVVNLGAPDRDGLQSRCEAVCERLGFRLAPLGSSLSASSRSVPGSGELPAEGPAPLRQTGAPAEAHTVAPQPFGFPGQR